MQEDKLMLCLMKNNTFMYFIQNCICPKLLFYNNIKVRAGFILFVILFSIFSCLCVDVVVVLTMAKVIKVLLDVNIQEIYKFPGSISG